MWHQDRPELFLNAPSSSRRRSSSNAGDSPGSSVFDLPLHRDPVIQTPTLEKRPHPFLAVNGRSLSDQEASKSEERKHTDDPEELSYSYLVISGGSGGNAICSAFANACYVLPVSDDGGSSSEIIRVLGGPSIGKWLSVSDALRSHLVC